MRGGMLGLWMLMYRLSHVAHYDGNTFEFMICRLISIECIHASTNWNLGVSIRLWIRSPKYECLVEFSEGYIYLCVMFRTGMQRLCCRSTNTSKQYANKCFILRIYVPLMEMVGSNKSIDDLTKRANFINYTGLIRYFDTWWRLPRLYIHTYIWLLLASETVLCALAWPTSVISLT